VRRANLVVALLTGGALVYILRLVRLQRLRSKYALLWLMIAVLLLPVALAPSLLERLADLMDVGYAPSALFLLAIGFLFMVVVHFSWELSRLETKVRTLAEELALAQAAREDGEEQRP
jgi:hypothetical protein